MSPCTKDLDLICAQASMVSNFYPSFLKFLDHNIILVQRFYDGSSLVFSYTNISFLELWIKKHWLIWPTSVH